MKTKNPDPLSRKILRLISSSHHPLGTKEIADRLAVSWDTADIKLKILHGSGQVEGRKILGGKGVWIWWKKDAFKIPGDPPCPRSESAGESSTQPKTSQPIAYTTPMPIRVSTRYSGGVMSSSL